MGIFSYPDEAAWIGSADFDGDGRRREPNAVAMLVLRFAVQSRIAPAHQIDSRQSRAWICDESPLMRFWILPLHWSRIPLAQR